MLRRMLGLTGLASVMLFMAACQPLSKNPLIDPNIAQRDTRLYGAWISAPAKDDENQSFAILQVGPAKTSLVPGMKEPEAGLVQAWYTQHNQKEPEVSEPMGLFFVSCPVESTWVASISEGVDISYVASRREDTASTKRITDAGKMFWFLRYEVNQDTLNVWGTPNLKAMDEAIGSGALKGAVERNEKGEPTVIHLTDSTEHLKKYFDANWQALFPAEPAMVFKRIGVPPAR